MSPNAAPKGPYRTIYAHLAGKIADELVFSPEEGPDQHLALIIEKIGAVRGDVSAVTLGDVRSVLARANQLSGQRSAILGPLRDHKDKDLIRNLIAQVFVQSDAGSAETESPDECPDDTEPLPRGVQRSVDALKKLVLASIGEAREVSVVIQACKNVCLQRQKLDPQLVMYVIDAVFCEFGLALSGAHIEDLISLKELGLKLGDKILVNKSALHSNAPSMLGKATL